MPPVPFAYGETAAAAFLYSYVPFLLLGFVFQFIARHLLYTTERVIVVGSFATSHHYCLMSVQPPSALTVAFFPRRRACPKGEHPYQKTEDGFPSSVFCLSKMPNRYLWFLYVPSMTESCFCGSARKTGLSPIFFSCEN